MSGGADSLALLALAVAAGCEVTAVHVDHGLRPGSDEEAAVVEAAAAALGAGFRSVRVHVEPGPNLEARARAARHHALGAGALVGHTVDDQAETVLGNLMRGAGPEGLAGIRADDRHPILGLRRAETEALCRALGLAVVEDPSNQDPGLPAQPHPPRGAPPARRRGRARRGRGHRPPGASGGATWSSTSTPRPPRWTPPMARHWRRRRWHWPGWPCAAGCGRAAREGHPPDAATVERVLAVARFDVRATEVGGGWRVARTGGRLRLGRARARVRPSIGVE